MTELSKAEIHVWHLEMTDKPESPPARHDHYDLKKADTALPELNRFLYASVGAPWVWYMRLNWSWQEWMDYLNTPGVETWIAYQGATPVGYFELQKQDSGQAEIAYFGLLPEFVGKGLGRLLLEDAITRAWDLAVRRIWLHTCTLDHPAALPNYLARGFRVFKEEDLEDMIPAKRLQPWPGADKP
ncbi:MAG: GNAT family N-acetyltransferase [Gammaproteobacteria bacterium]|jgi:GNAT superfamily N-acetyltransferase|nr:GNAT family N-acetyltransferase [Gammaproteobacteria bacterium]MBT4492824.1 GNAT family N-acetyltransferase [Gammaproteobacteria bacterium]MBT7369024.1 GNAT family N-acetyltransferase [Gammaproteobacteria bacterium]